MNQNDSIISVTDTVSNPAAPKQLKAQVATDSVSRPIRMNVPTDDYHMSSVDTLPVATTTIDMMHDMKPWMPDSMWEGTPWPVTRWGDTIATPHALYSDKGLYGKQIPYNYARDNWFSGLLVICFLALIATLAWSRKYITKQARDFFSPTNNPKEQKKIKTTFETLTPFIMAGVLSISNGLALFAVTSHHYDLEAGLHSPLVTMAFCIGIFITYYLSRWLMYKFVNWIFFSKSKKRTWNNGFSFLTSLESLLFYPIILLMLNLEFDFAWTGKIAALTFAFIRICLLYHTYRIFFHKIYGLFHLFAYLCMLEIMPILLLWKFFVVFNAELIAK